MRKVRILALFALVLVSLGWTSRALATTITIDGNPADWPAGSSMGLDNAENGGIPDVTTPFPEPGVDIREVFFTNNTTTMFWRIDTFGDPTRWEDAGSGDPLLFICMNTDNNTATGRTVSACASQQGVDYRLRLTGTGPSTLTADLLQCVTLACNTVVASSGATAASAGSVTEVAIPLAPMNITTGRTIPSAIYFDNREPPNDDNTPNSGTIGPQIPGPTAITLSSLNASTAATTLSGQGLAWAGFALVAAGGLGGLLLRRRRAGRI